MAAMVSIVDSFLSPAAAGGALSAGCRRPHAFISPSGWRAPQAYFSLAGKVGKRALGRPQAPTFSLIGRYQRRCPVASEFLQGLRPPRDRCGGLLYFA